QTQHRVDIARLILIGPFQHAAYINGWAIAFEMIYNVLDFFVRHKRAVTARDPGAAGHIEHVAHAQQLLGTHLAQDCAAIDLGRDLKADTRREVRLDRAGDDIDRWALRGHDDVDSARPSHLREALDAGFDLLTGDHHQIG